MFHSCLVTLSSLLLLLRSSDACHNLITVRTEKNAVSQVRILRNDDASRRILGQKYVNHHHEKDDDDDDGGGGV